MWSKLLGSFLGSLQSFFFFFLSACSRTLMYDVLSLSLSLDSPTTTHKNLASGSMNDISDKPEKDQVSQSFLEDRMTA